MPQQRPILQVGHPILRQTAEAIADLPDVSIDQLVADLIHTLTASHGVGIAAPQVAASVRLVIVASRPNSRYPNAPMMAPVAMINPQIMAYSDQQEWGWEGCLSVPGLRGFVPRYQQIEVQYLTPKGEQKQEILTGFVARIFQHEWDHLNGLLFLDRVKAAHHLITEEAFQAQMNQLVGAAAKVLA